MLLAPRPLLVWLSLALVSGTVSCSASGSSAPVSLPGSGTTGGANGSAAGTGGLSGTDGGAPSGSTGSGGRLPGAGLGAGGDGSGMMPGAGGVTGTGGSASGAGGAIYATGGSAAGPPPTGTGGSSGYAGASGAGALGRGGSGGAGGAVGAGGGAGSMASGAGGSSAGQGGRGGSAGEAGRCPSGAIFCADFESGTIPAQALFFPEYLRPQLSTYVTIDAAGGLNGGRAARFAGTSFSQMLGVATGTPTFWTRVYLRMDMDVSMVTGHGTYLLATDGNGDPNVGEQIRVGEHTCQLELNRRSDDKELLSNGGMYSCEGGIAFAKNSWYCLETFYDGPGKQVRVFVNGTESTALKVTDWGPYNYGMFKFGFEKYSSPSRTIWYDDVAVAAQRVGCH